MEKNMSMLKRIMAVLLVLTMIAGNIPMGVRAEEVAVPEDSYLETSITEGMVFAVNEPTEYTYKTCPDAEDAGKTVKGSFAISKDGTPVNMADVAKLEYKDSSTGNWYEFYTDFGPATGFPLMNLTSNFRITFKETGNYSVTVSINEVNGGTLFSDTKNIKVEKVDATVKSTLSENELIVNKLIDFTVTTEANSDFGKNVIGSFVVKEGDTVINLTDVAQLEYYEIQNDTWYPLAGDFGPSTGFPLQNTSSQFRIKFTKAGTYTVLTTLKDVDAGTDLISAEETIEVKYVKSVLTTDMAEKTYVVGRETFYSFTTTPNSDDKVKVKGAFEVKQGGTVVNLSNVAELKYYETQSNQWLPLTGEFGPADGFEMSETTSNFSVIFKQPGTYTVKVYMKDMSGKELCATEVPLTVTEPTAVYSLKSGENTYEPIEDKWYTSAQTVRVKVDNIDDKEYLTDVKLNGAIVETEWTKEDMSWSKEFTMDSFGTVQYGDQDPVTVKIDSVLPTAEIPSAEVRDGKTTGKYSVTVGASKLKTVTIGGKEISINEAEGEDNNDGTFTYTGTFELSEEVESVSIVAVNNAGASSEATEKKPQDALKIAFTGAIETLGTVEDLTYLNKDNKEYVVITVSGTEQTGDYSMLSAIVTAIDQEDKPINVGFSWNGTAWQANVPLSNGLNKLEVTFYDQSGRDVSGTFDTKYAIDKAPPVVTVTRSINPVNTVGNAEYYNAPVTYTFTISDIMLGEDNPSNVTFTIEGKETQTVYFADGKAEVKVNNPDKLTNITVNAVDKMKNPTTEIVVDTAELAETWTSGTSYNRSVIVDTEDPIVKMTVSENVKYFYTDKDGYVFAVLDPMDHKDENAEIKNETVVLTVTVEDKNLDDSCFGPDDVAWTVENGKATANFTATVDDHQTGLLKFGFTYKDLAGWTNRNEDKSLNITAHGQNAQGFETGFTLNTETAGSYSGEFRVDRRAPSSSALSKAPTIELETETDCVTKGDNLQLFSGNVTYQMSITDLSEEEYDAGVKNVSWSVSAEDAPGFLSVNESGYEINEKGYVTEDGKYEINVTTNGNQETDNAKLKIVVEDGVGNKYTYYKNFAVDNLAPRVNVVYDNNDAASDTYFKAERTATITITDINYNGVTVTTEGEVVITENGAVCTYAKDGNYTLSMTTTDLAGNTTDNNGINYLTGKNEKGEEVTNVAPTAFTVDMTPPVVEVTMDLNGGTLVNTLNGVDYYNANVTYKVKVSDLEINKDTNAVAYVKFILEDSPAKEIQLLTLDDNDATEAEEYVAEFTLEDGQVLTGIEIVVLDNATNKPAQIADFEFDSTDKVWKYTKNSVVVDTTAPEISVEKAIDEGGKYVQTYNNVDYYDGAVKYTVKVTDAFLDVEVAKAELIVTYLDDSTKKVELTKTTVESETVLIGAADEYTGSFTVENGMAVKAITLNIVDNAGNTVSYDEQGKVTNMTVVDTDNLTAFKYEQTEKIWNYAGNVIVVDTVAPTARLVFSENIIDFYTNGTTLFAIVKNPVVADSGATLEQKNEEVTVTLTVTDLNLAYDMDEKAIALKSNEFKWNGEAVVNGNNTFTYVAKNKNVYPDGTSVFEFDVTVHDLAGHKLEDFNSNVTSKGYFLPVTPDDNGQIYYIFCLDRERPYSEKDENGNSLVTIKPSVNPEKTESDLELFNQEMSYNLLINDGFDPDAVYSGMKSVEWEVTDPNGIVESIKQEPICHENNSYDIPIALTGMTGESNEVNLGIKAVDNVGNTINFARTFAMDTLAPRISYFYYENGEKKQLTDGTFFNNPTVIEVCIEDLNMDKEFKENGGHYITVTNTSDFGNFNEETDKYEPVENTYVPTITMTQDGIVYSYKLNFSVGGKYYITTNATDLAKNASGDEIVNFELDMIAPEVKVEKSVEQGKGLIKSADGVDYYDGDVTYHVTVSDKNIDPNLATVMLQYSFEDGTEVLMDINDNNWIVTEQGEKTVYKHDIVVKDQEVLTGIALCVIDNASNAATIIDCNDQENTAFAYLGEMTNMHVYAGTVVVDKQAPQVVVTKEVTTADEAPQEGAFVQTYNNVDYYSGPITYTVTVSDNFLTEKVGTSVITAHFTDGSTQEFEIQNNETSTDSSSETLAALDEYTYKFTLDDSKVLENISINVVDNSGNVALKPDVQNADRTEFDLHDGVWNYTGNGIVVDHTAPTASLEFIGDVKSLYRNGNTVYFIMEKPVDLAAGNTSVNANANVTVKMTVTDHNIAYDNKEGAIALKANEEYGFAWAGTPAVNEENTYIFEATSGDVLPDGTQVFYFDVTVADLAGNVLTDFNSNTTSNGTTFQAVEVDENGHIQYTYSLDRRTPTSTTEDAAAPEIIVTPVLPSGISITKTRDQKDLFNGAFSFKLDVYDGKFEDGNSGLLNVKWTLSDEKGVIQQNEKEASYEGVVTYEKHYTIPVAFIEESGESNDVTLVIEAVDNVGNHISFRKVFGVDNLDPRVNVDFDNNSAQNDKYFKADRKATITITDINYNGVTVNTEGQYVVNTNEKYDGATVVCTYNTDGDYTLSLSTTDLANNTSSDEEENIDYIKAEGKTNVAPTDFTVDKTAPVIHVNYNPAFYVDVDGAGVQYFDEDRTVTVTIEEHNFKLPGSAPIVESDLGAMNTLSAWTDNGDNHTAYSTFTEGNGYSVKVNYTDLAGNPAQGYVSPTFSIDKTAPTIELTKGEMTTSQMNIVSGDLLLGFTINDAQDNLKDFGEASVEVMYIGTDFKQKKVEGAEFYTVTGAGDRTTGYIDFTNIENTKANDGIYTVRITASDYAGHVVTLDSDLVFSLNRFGSTFMVNDSFTEGFLAMGETGVTYHQNVSDKLVVKEINPNKVYQNADKSEDGSLITISVNGSAFALNKGEDYDVSVEEVGNGNNKWYEYTYSINPSVFDKDGEQVDGEYSILFYSEDEANNKNTNESNEGSAMMLTSDGEYSGKIEFTLDHKNPVVTILGIEEGGNYNESFMTVDINISDNTPVAVRILVDGTEIKMLEDGETEATNTDWFFYDKDSGNYKLNLSEKKSRQDVEVIVADAAGNEIAESVNRLNINSNVFFLFINNVPAVLATVVGLIGLTVMIIALLKKRKKGAA